MPTSLLMTIWWPLASAVERRQTPGGCGRARDGAPPASRSRCVAPIRRSSSWATSTDSERITTSHHPCASGDEALAAASSPAGAGRAWRNRHSASRRTRAWTSNASRSRWNAAALAAHVAARSKSIGTLELLVAPVHGGDAAHPVRADGPVAAGQRDDVPRARLEDEPERRQGLGGPSCPLAGSARRRAGCPTPPRSARGGTARPPPAGTIREHRRGTAPAPARRGCAAPAADAASTFACAATSTAPSPSWLAADGSPENPSETASSVVSPVSLVW